MRIANLSGRLHLLDGDLAIDVEKASDGQFGADPQAVYQRWAEFADWAGSARLPSGAPSDRRELGSPAPAPAQVFAVGLNYDEHAAEAGFIAPDTEPPIFTKFVSSIAGADCAVEIPDGRHLRRSSAWGSRTRTSARSDPGWSPSTSAMTRMTWSLAALSTGRRCSGAGRPR